MSVKKHSTSSTFVFSQGPDGWELGMVLQPRLGKVMVAGGHEEDDETSEECAVREVVEEMGVRIRLIDAPAPSLPIGYPHPLVAQPWWITELQVPRDNHLDEDHVHVDHVFVAVADDRTPVSEPVHEVLWLSEAQVAENPNIFEDTKILAKELFVRIGELAAA